MAMRALDLLKIGDTQNTMQSLRALGLDYAPQTWYQPYARLLDDATGDGQRVRRGFPRATWSFDILTVPQVEIFEALLDDQETATVYVCTLAADNNYVDFQAVMQIPLEEREWGSRERWSNVTIAFTRLQAV